MRKATSHPAWCCDCKLSGCIRLLFYGFIYLQRTRLLHIVSQLLHRPGGSFCSTGTTRRNHSRTVRIATPLDPQGVVASFGRPSNRSSKGPFSSVDVSSRPRWTCTFCAR
eukprot:NODE_2743_length_1049_cov_3.900000_g2290_i0.p4 GENE.NODE_2743_length_1049_cov_3.900000_g2290_i0~~NODE_2743_length_1049_cov_3.900000_g2290_i0.p4  ORF type:complete len:110 (-),score=0.43 NODE_2743_length_1049_cov_3.900000_g2290_i0:248-577(-)